MTNSEQIQAFKTSVLEEALAKLITRRDRLASNLQTTNENIKQLQAAIAAP